MLIVRYGNSFKKDLKVAQKRGLKIEILKEVVEKLANQNPLPPKYREHYLTNNYKRL